ncbi:MAG: bifunctional 4-hydroxy-2-oxoglutarate aldolase/2-dehydro-3-deoxy-phosphogluconate aldolase [Clostridiales bacterium]|jgi:2-dehydro-3-deoxyphosphogluconate aldolase/(4S)-4-hydroxy-2-oxoglutarate aldolase|nr:bifunctional 4-hydroxy-2-oxoglutarate aldolase/2-dehydro-3-deoxy-phosphogluconate aldolase [Clostridiales bacterium]
MSNILQQIEDIGIVPVVTLGDVNKAKNLGSALIKGGLNAAEVTFRVEGADKVISAMAKHFPNMLVGAGTVLTEEQADRAVKAGAKFLVAPGLNAKVVKHCQSLGVTFIPGVSSASEVELALELGLSHVKFFPAEQAGGVAYIKSISAPYTTVKFMPTGGVSDKNVNDYLSLNSVFACGGSWMVAGELIKSDNWDEVTRLTSLAVDKMLGFEFVHMGIHSSEQKSALAGADKLVSLFGLDKKVGNSSVFITPQIEITNTMLYKKVGHIAIRTNSMKRAIAMLKSKGIALEEDSIKTKPDGSIHIAYLKDVDINGFAVHLIAK